jgi:hypothetical protein
MERRCCEKITHHVAQSILFCQNYLTFLRNKQPQNVTTYVIKTPQRQQDNVPNLVTLLQIHAEKNGVVENTIFVVYSKKFCKIPILLKSRI